MSETSVLLYPAPGSATLFSPPQALRGNPQGPINLLDEFSQAMTAVSSTNASSSKNLLTRENSSSLTSWSERVMASAYSSATRSFSS